MLFAAIQGIILIILSLWLALNLPISVWAYKVITLIFHYNFDKFKSKRIGFYKEYETAIVIY